jgi:hypothetical protein
MSMTGRITGSPVDSSAGEPLSLEVDDRDILLRLSIGAAWRLRRVALGGRAFWSRLHGRDVRVRVRVGFLGPMAVLPRPGLLASVAIPGVRGVR